MRLGQVSFQSQDLPQVRDRFDDVRMSFREHLAFDSEGLFVRCFLLIPFAVVPGRHGQILKSRRYSVLSSRNFPAQVQELLRLLFSFRPATFRLVQQGQALERLCHLQIVRWKQLSSDLQRLPEQGFRFLLPELVIINAAQTTERGGHIGMVRAVELQADGERFPMSLFSVRQVSLLPKRIAQMIKRCSSLSAVPAVQLLFVRQRDTDHFYGLIILADIHVEHSDQTAQLSFDCWLIVQFCANALGCPIQNVLQLDPDIPATGDSSPNALDHVLQEWRHYLTLLASLSLP